MFVDIFNELLAENDLNKKKFSEQSGIPYPTIIGWTNLNRLPDYTALSKIADFFHCSVDYLMGRQEDFNNGLDQIPQSQFEERTLLNYYRRFEPENKELIRKITINLSKRQ